MGVCIVDDSEVSREVIKKALTMNEFECALEAVDGVDAVEKIKDFKGKLDLFILDINMPRMDGLTLISEIRKLNTSTPIIMLTTETDKEKMAVAKERGAAGWIVKPFDSDKFIKVIKMVTR